VATMSVARAVAAVIIATEVAIEAVASDVEKDRVRRIRQA